MRHRNWITEVVILSCLLGILLLHIMILLDIFRNGLGRSLFSQGMSIFLMVIPLTGEVPLCIMYITLPKYIEVTDRGVYLLGGIKFRKIIEWPEVEKISVSGPLVNSTFIELKSGGREGLGLVSNKMLNVLLQKFETYKSRT